MFQGSMVAIVTPFLENNHIDYDALAALVEFQIDNGTSAIVPCGTTGESPTLTPDEHHEVIQRTIEFVNKRVPVIAGTGSNSTQEAINMSRAAEEAGANGLLIVNPYYNKPTQDGLVRHYTTVADSVNLPIILYNIPGRCAVGLELDTIITLSKHKNIHAIKEATGNVDFASQIKQATDLILLSGDDPLTLPLFSIGAVGVVSVTANIAPRGMAELVQLATDGKFTEALEIHRKHYPLFKALFTETNPIGIKTALGFMGKCRPELRAPLYSMAESNAANLKSVLHESGLL